MLTLKPPVPDVYVYEAPKRVLVDVEPPSLPKDTRAEDEGRLKDEVKRKDEEEDRERKRRESLHTYEITTVTSDIK